MQKKNKNIYLLLKKPLPYCIFPHSSLFMGSMIFFILAIFHPFGLFMIPGIQKYVIELGFGLITFLIMCVNLRILPKLFPTYFSDEEWNVYKEICFTLYIISLISIANTLYLHYLNFFVFNLYTFGLFIFYTIIIAIFPVFLMSLIKYNRILKRHYKDAKKINSKISETNQDNNEFSGNIFKYSGSSESDSIELLASQILYIQSQRNYLNFVFMKNDEIKSKLLRGTLKDVELLTDKFSNLQRCHRSFIVNINQIKNLQGDSLGFTLHLENTEKTIPVSRSYTKTFKKLFK